MPAPGAAVLNRVERRGHVARYRGRSPRVRTGSNPSEVRDPNHGKYRAPEFVQGHPSKFVVICLPGWSVLIRELRQLRHFAGIPLGTLIAVGLRARNCREVDRDDPAALCLRNSIARGPAYPVVTRTLGRRGSRVK